MALTQTSLSLALLFGELIRLMPTYRYCEKSLFHYYVNLLIYKYTYQGHLTLMHIDHLARTKCEVA